MSARIRMRVLRVPCEKVGVADPWAFSEAHESEFPALGTCPYFAVAPTVRPFIDYVLRDQISDAQSFGKTRSLTPAEKRRYGPAFRRLFPEISMDDVRHVECCVYSGCAAPEYYDEGM